MWTVGFEDAAPPFLTSRRPDFAGHDAARQNLPIVRKTLEPSARAEVRMVHTEASDRLVVRQGPSPDLPRPGIDERLGLLLEDLHEPTQGRKAQMAVPLRQTDTGDELRRLRRKAELPPKPGTQARFVLNLQKSFDDGAPPLVRKSVPDPVERFL